MRPDVGSRCDRDSQELVTELLEATVTWGAI